MSRAASVSTIHAAMLRVIRNSPVISSLGAGGLALLGLPGIAFSVIIGIIHLIGFGSLGIGPASVAAAKHAAIGIVAAGSWFATLTSAGAGGYGVAVITSMVKLLGAFLASLAGAIGILRLSRA
ncbi:uncharacterized protein B0I36DRAFT_387483 [Microdochium trichocladiopsis]|uniref:Uncharacterized protein n=1 Tax=Microdochium trichocladiopsis TaxID=1682393 RepID=A0A9P8XXL8_9PEZI|nr:uncharacterized protein B0I36DRAFT_387483 [Microdochium trichocladiopsis]KAH7025124.1 hypothetical protein B0I36DRAFT_387483 [Microdochium trichocladiopsis]